MGIAFGSLLLYSFGIPILLAVVLYHHRHAITEDQELWRQGKGSSRELNPHYYVRKKYGKLYQYFKSQYFYWVVVILCRKLCISLIIAGVKSPLFAASLGVLLLFCSMLAHISTKPYLTPSTYSFGQLASAEADTSVEDELSKGKSISIHEARFRHMRLPLHLCKKYRVPMFTGLEGMSDRERSFLYEQKEKMLNEKPIKRQMIEKVRNVLAEHRYRYLQSLVLYNYNKMESRFLQSSIFVLLSGIMFHAAAEQRREQNPGLASVTEENYQAPNDTQTLMLGTLVMLAVGFCSVYFLSVMVVEVYKYFMLYQSVKRWEMGETDEFAQDNHDILDDAAFAESASRFQRWRRKLQKYLLPSMYGGNKSASTRARTASGKAKLHLGNPSDKPGHIEMGAGLASNPMHNPDGPSVFGTNPMSDRNLLRQEKSNHSRGASMASSVDFSDRPSRASDNNGMQPEKMQDQVFAMLDGQEDPVRGERGWSVFPDGGDGG